MQKREGKRQLAAFRQSEPVGSRGALLERLAAVSEEPGRPPFWHGYRGLPERFEFWTADKDYVHERFEYLRSGDGWPAPTASRFADATCGCRAGSGRLRGWDCA